MELEKVYNPKLSEEKWYSYWEKEGFFKARVNPEKTPYTIVIPPPNVTGVLHMGHALNNTIQDILIRYKRMQGFEALWMPGTDHAGIATQNVVERKLAKEKKRKEDIGRDAFIEEVWAWKHKHGDHIIKQLKRLGCSCDWSRERFTMDEGLSHAVKYTFHELYQKDLIYRGNYIINWCPRCQTALADEEAEHKDVQGSFYHIRYQVEGLNESIVIATTRPETMFGDTAVAMNPSDKRYAHLKGKKVIIPFIEKAIPIIEDEHVDPEFGTGLVKVTPAHDPNDFDMALRHRLELVNVMTGKGEMVQAGPYDGLDRFECRKKLVKDLEQRGQLEKVEPHMHAVGHCYRCNTIIEPRASIQWFVRMKPLAEKAIAAAEQGELEFHPPHWKKIYLNWLNEIRDWCISRQIWWGHRIPVWYDEKGDQHVSMDHLEQEGFKQDQDVLDTWFSSWLWPMSTLGWPENTEELSYFYPTQTLVTAPDILFFWVARMIMAGLEFKQQVPFKDIYLHGVVRDDQGRKMSKSLGNSIDPLEVVEEFSADALRFSIIMIAPSGQDVYLSNDKFELGRNFANKIWNATRFLLLNIEDVVEEIAQVSTGQLTAVDKWIISRLNRTIQDATEQIEKFRLSDAAHAIYDFLWHDFCDWYIEMIKQDMQNKTVQAVAVHVLEQTLRLLHPFMPFVTEELWHTLPIKRNEKSIMVSSWPQAKAGDIDESMENQFNLVKDVIQSLRNCRRELNVKPKQPLHVSVQLLNDDTLMQVQLRKELVQKLAGVSDLELSVVGEKPDEARAIVREYGTIYVHLAGLIDVNEERKRLQSELDKIEQELIRVEGKLGNESFTAKAPPQVVEQERQKQQTYVQLKDELTQQLMSLK